MPWAASPVFHGLHCLRYRGLSLLAASTEPSMARPPFLSSLLGQLCTPHCHDLPALGQVTPQPQPPGQNGDGSAVSLGSEKVGKCTVSALPPNVLQPHSFSALSSHLGLAGCRGLAPSSSSLCLPHPCWFSRPQCNSLFSRKLSLMFPLMLVTEDPPGAISPWACGVAVLVLSTRGHRFRETWWRCWIGTEA